MYLNYRGALIQEGLMPFCVELEVKGKLAQEENLYFVIGIVITKGEL